MNTPDSHDTSLSFQQAFRDPVSLSFDLNRARWLGICSERIYPSTREELQANLLAVEARTRQRQKRRSWWQLYKSKVSDQEIYDLRLKAEKAKANIAVAESSRITAELRAWGFDQVKFLTATSTQCCVATSLSMTLICFRGTESNRFSDIYADLMAFPIKNPAIEGLLHKGFYDALSEVWGQSSNDRNTGENNISCIGLVEELRRQRVAIKADTRNLVWIAGHSLGGALATLATSRLVAERVITCEDIGGIYTFGQPRVADEQFASRYALAERHYRVIHSNDVVTRVPPDSLRLLGYVKNAFIGSDASWLSESQLSLLTLYRHVGQQVHITADGGVVTGVKAWTLFQRRLLARIRNIATGYSWSSRLVPDFGDHSMKAYNNVLQSSNTSHRDGEPNIPKTGLKRTTALHIGSLSGVCIGAVLGFYIREGLPFVVGLLLVLLVLPLSMDDRFFQKPYALAFGSFGFSATISLILIFLKL